ncbi:MAG: zinc ABC transporter substrate-binding protein, partial [Pseudomonadota bacterium]
MFRSLWFTLLAVFALAGQSAVAQDRLSIVATTGMVADVAAGVAGDRADVETLMGPGVDPHLYKPTRSDVRRLMNADVIFYNGLLLEGQLTDALIRAATSGKKVFAVTEMLSDDDLLEPEELEGKFDPHVWMDVRAWSNTVAVVRDTLAEIDPDGASTYEENAGRYIEKLMKLDEYAERALKSVPESQRVLVTAHDAFNYF